MPQCRVGRVVAVELGKEMWNSHPELSVVVPVCNGAEAAVGRVESLLDELDELVQGEVEVVVVDDGSDDATAQLLENLAAQRSQVRLVHHPRKLGFEIAGQSGLERARADLVFICEDDRPLRIADLRQLWRLAADTSMVAARAESTPRPLASSFVHRVQQLAKRPTIAERSDDPSHPTGIQMLRRPALQYLSGAAEAEVEHVCYHTDSAAPCSG